MYDMIDMKNEIGERIRDLREGLGLSQADIAKAVGVKRPTVTGWETGHRIPDRGFLPSLADVLGTTVDYILSGELTSDKETKRTIRNHSLHEKLEDLENMLRDSGATEDDVETILGLLEYRRRLREAQQ